MTHKVDRTPNRLIEVPAIARVEGEGALHLGLRGDEIVDLRLDIYEPPRFFEAFLAGRHFSEVPDIVPRICGICPVAYQMSAIHAWRSCSRWGSRAGTRELRRLLYCAEWIESHMLHVHLLAAPTCWGTTAPSRWPSRAARGRARAAHQAPGQRSAGHHRRP